MVTEDVDGSARINGATVDIGAYEYDTTISVSASLTTTLTEGSEGVTVTLKLFSDPPPLFLLAKEPLSLFHYSNKHIKRFNHAPY